MRLLSAVLGLVASCLVPALSAAEPAVQPKLDLSAAIPQDRLASYVDGVIGYAMTADHIAGLSVVVVQDGKTVFQKGYGISGTGPGQIVDPEKTLFRIGSIGKTLTWVLLMQEVERGRVKLDAPINDYLPAALKIPDAGFRKPVRIVDLMAHAGGFEDNGAGHLIVDKPERVMPLDSYLVKYHPAQVRESGEVSSYSNYAIGLVGAMLAHLNGKDYETLVEERLLRPLNLHHTTFREPYGARPDLPKPLDPALAKAISTGFGWNGVGFEPRGFEYIHQIAPAGSTSTTAADMARYMTMLLNNGELDGQRIFGAETARAFRTPVLNLPEGFNGWAHGFSVMALPGGLKGYMHGGSTQSFKAQMTLIPDLRMGVFIAANTNTGRQLAYRLPSLLVENFYAVEPPRKPSGKPALAQRADLYDGTYVTTRRAYHGLEQFIGLISGQSTLTLTADGKLITRSGDGGQIWVADGAPGLFRSVDGQDVLKVNTDASGRVVSYITGTAMQAMERQPWYYTLNALMLAAGLAALASVAILVAVVQRALRGGLPAVTRLPVVLATGTALLWTAAFIVFYLWLPTLSNGLEIALHFPGQTLTLGSRLALAATTASLLMALYCLRFLRGGTFGRWSRSGFALVALAYVFFGGMLALWGYLPIL